MAETAAGGDPASSDAGDAVAAPCKDCGEGFLWSGEPTGTEIALGDLPTYVAKPDASEDASTSAAILFLHDAFGWKFPNNRLLCDRLANSTGLHVYLPDLYDGATVVTEQMAADLFDPKPTILGKVAQGFKMFVTLPGFMITMQKYGAQRTQPDLDKVVEEIKKGHGGDKCRLGAVGYCWGGKYSLRLGAQGKVAASVACHPSLVDPTADGLSKMSAACLFIRAEHDFIFGDKLWKQTEAAIKGAGATVEDTVYPGTKHGFAVRCSEADAVSCRARDDAFVRTADWFSKYLK